MYGGIRCEKAAAALIDAGYEDVYQLDGGILQYFEECGGEYYEGECFVFDKRVSVGADLKETETRQCYLCRSVVTVEEQQSASYIEKVCCPHCIAKDADKT